MIKTKYGTKVEVVCAVPPFVCDGKETERVMVINVDNGSPSIGRTVMMNTEDLRFSNELEDVLKNLDKV